MRWIRAVADARAGIGINDRAMSRAPAPHNFREREPQSCQWDEEGS
jgi:hypothetical protein